MSAAPFTVLFDRHWGHINVGGLGKKRDFNTYTKQSGTLWRVKYLKYTIVFEDKKAQSFSCTDRTNGKHYTLYFKCKGSPIIFIFNYYHY